MIKKAIIIVSVGASVALLSSFIKSKPAADCGGCGYDMTFVKTINQGDDSKYKLYCNKTRNSYDVYQRKNGRLEGLSSDRQYSMCELVKYLCDCN